MSRVVAFSWGLGLVALTALPVLRLPERDAFPFSTYPMFATPRDKPTLLVAEVTTEGRESLAIPPQLVANGPVMQAMSTLSRAEQQGPEALHQLCLRIARRVKDAPELAGARRVQIVSARFDPIAYFETGPKPEARRVLERCSVRGGS
jgi:hypothetical protein